jgi:hypothetical protein
MQPCILLRVVLLNYQLDPLHFDSLRKKNSAICYCLIPHAPDLDGNVACDVCSVVLFVAG